jgi:hypothetical protein
MFKFDSNHVKLRKGDWVKFRSMSQCRVGQVSKLHPPLPDTIFRMDTEIEITMPSGNRSIRSSNYTTKINEEEAMLFLLESE